jgi:hypothetical protein
MRDKHLFEDFNLFPSYFVVNFLRHRNFSNCGYEANESWTVCCMPKIFISNAYEYVRNNNKEGIMNAHAQMDLHSAKFQSEL